MVALGKHRAGLFGSDDTLIKDLQKAAEDSGDHGEHRQGATCRVVRCRVARFLAS